MSKKKRDRCLRKSNLMAENRPIRTCVRKLDTRAVDFIIIPRICKRTIIINKIAINYALKMDVAQRFIANIFLDERQANRHVHDETLCRRDN